LSFALALGMFTGAFAQEGDRNVGIASVLKPLPGMGYELDQALTHYNKTFRTDPKYAVRVSTVIGGPRAGSLISIEPVKTWAEIDEPRPYQGDASARAWQNVLKHCESYETLIFTIDTKRSNPLPQIKPTTKFIGYFWEIDSKSNEEAFSIEFEKALDLLKKAGYHFVATRNLSGRVVYQIQLQFENGWKDMEKNLPNYKDLFIKANPGKGEWEKHQNIFSISTKDFYTEYRTIRTAMSTR
jgi:hypothetical protein